MANSFVPEPPSGAGGLSRLLCRLGLHDYQWVGEQIERDLAEGWESEPWNHECHRCGKQVWMTTTKFKGERTR